MLAGTLGSDERMQYTVVGDPVNVAARLCGLSYPGKLVISETSYQLAGGTERIISQNQKFLKVRGKSAEIPTYIIDGVMPPYSARIEEYVTKINHSLSEESKGPEIHEPA